MLSNTPPSPLAPDDPTTPACLLRHRSACWHPLLPQPHLVSTATDTTAAPTVCASPPDFPHFKHVCTPTVLASLAPAAPTASSAVLNYTLASSTACAASASPSLQACAHPVLPHLHFLKRVSTDPTFALRAPFAPAAFLPHLHLLKHVPNDTTLALMAPASACVAPKSRLLHFTFPVYVASRSFP